MKLACSPKDVAQRPSRIAGGEIAGVDLDGIAAAIGLQPGDVIVSVNGRPVRDLIDYRYATACEEVSLRVVKPDGEEWVADIEKDADEGLGLSFVSAVFDDVITCRNRCLFCFVDQMPRGLRPSLYVKDDDYRLSFLQGCYITLGNLSSADLERIVALRLSPLYVSVHATDDATRTLLMGPGAAGIMDRLAALTRAGIEVHTQIVLCPGENDGPRLEETVLSLASLWPALATAAVVPVGLTAHREGLTRLRPVDAGQATAVLDQLARIRRLLSARGVEDFLFASDEFYLLAGRPIPGGKSYVDFAQLANGVGTVRLFLDDLSRARAPRRAAGAGGGGGADGSGSGEIALATGTLFAPILTARLDRIRTLTGARARVLTVENSLLGPSVTVAGLMAGADIIAALRRELTTGRRPVCLLVPSVAVREGDGVFLDGMSPGDIVEATGIATEVVPADGRGLIRRLREMVS
jgi:putative radical SAM enzyme (TIGR03279 family)